MVWSIELKYAYYTYERNIILGCMEFGAIFGDCEIFHDNSFKYLSICVYAN